MDSKIVWQPLKGSQTLALSCPAHIIVYHGTRGPGKTDAQLMRFRRRVGQGYGRHWRGVIFDREYKNLDDIVSKSLRWFPEFKDGARFNAGTSDYRWTWPTGEQLLFRTAKRDADYWNYHGQEFPFIGWNELTKYPNDALFDSMMSCNRSSFRPQDFPIIDPVTGLTTYPPDIPLEVFATCNPFGPGHNWVKKRFISLAPMGQIVKKSVSVFNPREQKREDVVKTQVHLFGSYRENIYLPPEYIAELESITDTNKRKAWLQGDWDVISGGMFDAEWDSMYHVVKPFAIPASWKIDRSFDYGSSKPFSVGWWAESDGSDVMLADGTWKSTVRGDLFRVAEWYGCEANKANVGLRMLTKDISAGIVQREQQMRLGGRVTPGPADNSIWDVLNGNSIAADMSKPVTVNGQLYPGVEWRRSDKSPGSRKAGWNKMREMLHNAKNESIVNGRGKRVLLPREKPGLFIFNTCPHFIELFPILPRSEKDPDDVDTDAEDHIADEARYRVLSTNIGAKGARTKGT